MSSGRVGLGIGLVVVVMGLAWASGAVASGEECRDDWCPRPGAIHQRTESCESYCTRFSACSIERNLAAASGEELERYRAEKAEDGREYADWPAPAVELPALRGGHISLAGLRGGPVVLVTLAAHCKHSYDTLPILEALQQKHRADGVSFVGVYVSSGTPADVRDSTRGIELSFPIGVDSQAELAGLLDSRMVPSAFLIDADGRIRQKLVGLKDEATLARAIEGLQLNRWGSLGLRWHRGSPHAPTVGAHEPWPARIAWPRASTHSSPSRASRRAALRRGSPSGGRRRRCASQVRTRPTSSSALRPSRAVRRLFSAA